jgi:hypothetical protein
MQIQEVIIAAHRPIASSALLVENVSTMSSS